MGLIENVINTLEVIQHTPHYRAFKEIQQAAMHFWLKRRKCGNNSKSYFGDDVRVVGMSMQKELRHIQSQALQGIWRT